MEQTNLFKELNPEKKKKSIKICDKPKTYKLVPFDATEEYIAKAIAMHFDEDGFKIEPVTSEKDF